MKKLPIKEAVNWYGTIMAGRYVAGTLLAKLEFPIDIHVFR